MSDAGPASGQPRDTQANAALVVTDMDGTLATVETWRGVHAWIRAHHPSAAARRFIAVQLPRVVIARLGLVDKEAFRARWLSDHARLLRGVPEDRLPAMGEWVVEHHLWPARRQRAIDAVAAVASQLRSGGARVEVVLASGAYQPIADAFAARVGADRALATPLEIVDGLATGRLALPAQSGDQKAAAVRALAAGRPIAVAFGDTAADVPMLALAQRAIAVAPDARLRRFAGDRGWEILDG